MPERTFWHRPGTDIYHDSRQCAGQHAVPVFGVFVDTADLDQCGLCEPQEVHTCDECGEVLATENSFRHHVIQKHVNAATDEPEAASRIRELNKKAVQRGEF